MKNKLHLLVAISLQGIVFAQAPNISYNTSQIYAVGTAVTLTPNNTGGAIAPGTVTILAGSGTFGSADGTGSSASFNFPTGIAVDKQGNIYVADSGNNKIRKISPLGSVSTLAGSGTNSSIDGIGTSASFAYPLGVAVDAQGNVYAADALGNKIRKITPSGTVSTLAGNGTQSSVDSNYGNSASFAYPHSVSINITGYLYVCDRGTNKIRVVSPSGIVTTLAGNGNYAYVDGGGTSASFRLPTSAVIDSQNIVYVVDSDNNRIRKINNSWVVSTFAGSGNYGGADGVGTSANFTAPWAGAIDAQNNIYVSCGSQIRKITPAATVSTLATSAGFGNPKGLAVDSKGYIYVADTDNNMIKKIEPGGYTVSPTLPAGLSINSTTGIISGTPTAESPQTTYTVTATNGSGTSTATIVLSVNSSLGIKDIAFKNMVVYPNPTTGEVNINNVTVEKVNVYNNAGQLVKTVINREAKNTTTVQLNDQPSGIYYMNIETENGCTVRQVIKK